MFKMSENKKILITSALPYVNNIPHLGNIIGCVLPADCLARYYKNVLNYGENCLYICGTDDYGTQSEIRAQMEGLTPREICDKYNVEHQKIYKWFNINFDYFGRTSTNDPQNDKDWKHTIISQDIFKTIVNNGFTIEMEVEQLYSEELDKFVSDRFVQGSCPYCKYDKANGDQCDKCGKLLNVNEIINPVYKPNPEYKLKIKTTNHIYLDLPKIRDRLEKWYNIVKENWANNSVNITDAWLKEGLKPRCITRDYKWGTPVPNTEVYGDKYKNKVMYNWFDAPIGYLSITANLCDWEQWWKNPKNVELIQFFSKDNIPFHSIIFPSTLLATLEDYTLVSKMASSEYLTFEGEKFSKTNNHGVFGDDVMKFDFPSDVWRFYLLIQRPENKDTDFSWDDFYSKLNGQLVNNIGNLVNRVVSLIYKNFKSIPTCSKNELGKYDKFIKDINSFVQLYHQNMISVKLKIAIVNILDICHLCNKFLVETEPWIHLKGKNNLEEENAKSVLNILVHIISLIARLLNPFMPETSEKIEKMLNHKYSFNELVLEVLDNIEINKPEILFKPVKMVEKC